MSKRESQKNQNYKKNNSNTKIKTKKGTKSKEIDNTAQTYHWFFTDIVGSSNPDIPTEDQIKKITELIDIIKKTKTYSQTENTDKYVLPTGDGMAIGFRDNPEKPVRLAVDIHKKLTTYNKRKRTNKKIELRIGIDTGPIYFIKDLENNNNAWGPGIIMARRVMDLCGPRNILASERIAKDLHNLSKVHRTIFHPIGSFEIKHGEKLKIYNIYGDNFGSKNVPKKSKVTKKTDQMYGEDLLKRDFEFEQIEIKIKVLNSEDSLTHHTYIWTIRNLDKEHPFTHVFYPLFGDVERKFEDLHVKVKDKNNNKLQISSIETNEDKEKRFKVKLQKPIHFGRTEQITIEYDWEEPKRNFIYDVAARCKKFKFIAMVPKSITPEYRVLKLDKNLGKKIEVFKPVPKIRSLKNHTEISWESKELKTHESYKFEW